MIARDRQVAGERNDVAAEVCILVTHDADPSICSTQRMSLGCGFGRAGSGALSCGAYPRDSMDMSTSFIREFMAKPESARHLYEIHTASQPPMLTGVLVAEHVVELARLRDFL